MIVRRRCAAGCRGCGRVGIPTGNQGHLSTSPAARDKSPTASLVFADAQDLLIYGLSSCPGAFGARPGPSRAANDCYVTSRDACKQTEPFGIVRRICLRALPPLRLSKPAFGSPSPPSSNRLLISSIRVAVVMTENQVNVLANSCYQVKCDKCGKTTWKVLFSFDAL